MKAQRNLFKWLGMAFLFATFISFTFLLPPAFAQEESLETETPTPSETLLSPEATPEPLEIPECPVSELVGQEGGKNKV